MGLFTGGFKLLIGMGTGTYATQCSKYLGNVNVEGVEIDEKITKLSRQYFSFAENVPVTTYEGGVMIDDAEFAKHVIKEIGM